MAAKRNGEKTETTLADVLHAIEELTRTVHDGFEKQRRDINSALTRDRQIEAKVAALETRVAKLERRRGS